MKIDPFGLFKNWYGEELQISRDPIPSACCLSTIGLDGYPNSRFVSLKKVTNDAFIIAGSVSSRKGQEIALCTKVALTFWWTHTQRQVRIQGDAVLIASSLADIYFKDRPRDAQIVCIISKQGEEWDAIESLRHKIETFEKTAGKIKLSRPKGWGGFSIKPVRVEFMDFKENRLHERFLYQKKNGGWITQRLQP